MDSPHSVAVNPSACLQALAVLGRADLRAVRRVAAVACESDDFRVAIVGTATSGRESLEIAPEAAADILQTLEQEDSVRYRELHERAVALLEPLLTAENDDVETRLIAIFARLADRLVKDDPDALITLVARAEQWPLRRAASRQQVRYFKAIALRKAQQYDEALAVFDELLAEEDLGLELSGRAQNSRAICYYRLGRWEDALNAFQQCRSLWHAEGMRLNEGKACLNVGIIAYELRDYELAAVSFERAIACFEETGALQLLASARNELGLLYRDGGEWDASLQQLALAAEQRRKDEAHDSLGRITNNMGEVYLLQGRLQEAVDAFQAALEKITVLSLHVDVNLNLALVYQARGEAEQAQTAAEQAIALVEESGRGDILPNVYYRMAEAQRHAGEMAPARAQYEKAVAAIEAMREPIRDEGIKINLLGRWQQVYETLVLHCLAQGDTAAAFAWAERARARAFADALAEDAQPEDAQLPGNGRTADVAAVQAALAPDELLLCYFTTGVLEQDVPLLNAIAADNPLRAHMLTAPHTLLFAVTKTAVTAHDCGIDPNFLSISSPRGYDRQRFLQPRVSRQLFQMLLAPAEAQAQARRVVIAPHGPLHHVPFAALQGRDARPLLREDGPVLGYAPSASVWLWQRRADRETAAGCLTVGYRGAADDLPLAEVEAQQVARLLQGTAYVGAQAARVPLREKAAPQRWLHFACHGWFDYERPLESYLEIGPEVRLTAREVLRQWHLRAELVTLSACQTGVSHILRGDEAMGLIRAFLYAGARAVLVTQWPVEDAPAFLLMADFYARLRAGETDAATALRQAQCWLREATAAALRQCLADLEVDSDVVPGDGEERPFAAPYHWAAFTLVGAG